MNVYTVRFSDKELIANNLRDFARIAVFAKWYLRSQSLAEPMKCSVAETDAVAKLKLVANSHSHASDNDALMRKPRRRAITPTMRKALRTFFYNMFA